MQVAKWQERKLQNNFIEPTICMYEVLLYRSLIKFFLSSQKSIYSPLMNNQSFRQENNILGYSGRKKRILNLSFGPTSIHFQSYLLLIVLLTHPRNFKIIFKQKGWPQVYKKFLYWVFKFYLLSSTYWSLAYSFLILFSYNKLYKFMFIHIYCIQDHF